MRYIVNIKRNDILLNFTTLKNKKCYLLLPYLTFKKKWWYWFLNTVIIFFNALIRKSFNNFFHMKRRLGFKFRFIKARFLFCNNFKGFLLFYLISSITNSVQSTFIFRCFKILVKTSWTIPENIFKKKRSITILSRNSTRDIFRASGLCYKNNAQDRIRCDIWL